MTAAPEWTAWAGGFICWGVMHLQFGEGGGGQGTALTDGLPPRAGHPRRGNTQWLRAARPWCGVQYSEQLPVGVAHGAKDARVRLDLRALRVAPRSGPPETFFFSQTSFYPLFMRDYHRK